MINLPKRFKTIRWRLTLIFISTFGGIITLFSLVTYNIQAVQYRTSIDNSLKVLTLSISDEIQADSLHDDLLSELQEAYIPFTSSSQHYVEIIDTSGNIILKSPQLKNSVLPFNSYISGSNLDVYRSFYIDNDEGLWNSNGLRVLYSTISLQSRKYIIIAGVPTENVESFLSDKKMIYYFSILITLLLSSVLGWYLSKKAYVPIKEIISKANLITVDNLSDRLPIIEPDDELSMLSKTLNDMIERLEKSFKTLKQFTSNSSHELKTPLTILRGQIEVAIERKRSAEEYENILKENLSEVIRLQSIVEKLLLLSQVDSGRLILSKQKVFINELLADVITKIKFISDKRNIRLVFKIDENANNSSAIIGDYNLLYNVFFDILENSIDYSYDNSTIICSINASEVKDKIVISITDFGIGISEENISHIFERFYRADTSRSKDGKYNLGLGLAIVKGIINAHKGEITVNSVLQKGSTFNVFLPIDVSE